MIKVNDFLSDSELFGKFPNKEIYPSLVFDEYFKEQTNISFIEWFFDEKTLYEDLFKLEMIAKVKTNVSLTIGFLPYSRSDKPNERSIFMLKFIADKINAMNFKEIIIVEPHSEVSVCLINNSKPLWATKELFYANNYCEDIVIVYPDAGALKRYAKDFKTEGYDYVCCFKERDKDGKIIDFQLFNPQSVEMNNRKFVIVDDLCSRGGTFIEIIERLKEFKPTAIDLIVAHVEENIFSGKILDENITIYTTIYTQRSKEHSKIIVKEL